MLKTRAWWCCVDCYWLSQYLLSLCQQSCCRCQVTLSLQGCKQLKRLQTVAIKSLYNKWVLVSSDWAVEFVWPYVFCPGLFCCFIVYKCELYVLCKYLYNANVAICVCLCCRILLPALWCCAQSATIYHHDFGLMRHSNCCLMQLKNCMFFQVL